MDGTEENRRCLAREHRDIFTYFAKGNTVNVSKALTERGHIGERDPGERDTSLRLISFPRRGEGGVLF